MKTYSKQGAGMATKKTAAERPVVVTTAHRGVFVGYTNDAPNAETITLTKARMVVYFGTNTRGVLGVAAQGVSDDSRVSPAVTKLVLRNVTAVMDATDHARAAWEREPWK